MQSELTLLQFVALALPAVAILLQAVIQQHDGIDDKDVRYWTEILLIQYSFYALVVSGLIFMTPIFLKSSSIYVKSGIIIAGGAMFLLLPATWFGLRRGRYGTSNYETPEREAVAKAKLYTPIFIGSFIVAVSVYAFSAVIDTISKVAGPEIASFVNSISWILPILLLLTFLAQVIAIFTKFKHHNRMASMWLETTRAQLDVIIDVVGDDLVSDVIEDDIEGSEDIRRIQKYWRRVGDLNQEWEGLLDSAPQNLDEEKRETAIEISSLLDRIDDIVGSLLSAHQDKRAYEDRYLNLSLSLSRARANQGEAAIDESISENPSDINQLEKLSEIARINNMKQVQKIEDLEDELEEYTEQALQLANILRT